MRKLTGVGQAPPSLSTSTAAAPLWNRHRRRHWPPLVLSLTLLVFSLFLLF
ncbi:hypothetical protein Hanom_Chr07g00625471 [Helianthus anomalus]